MAIPDYQSIMLPLMEFASNQKELSGRDAVEYLAGVFQLDEVEKKQRLPSGNETVFNNRVGWARHYLGKAGLLETTRRGFFRITQRGLDVLAQNPATINNKFLEQYPEFLAFRGKLGEGKPKAQVVKPNAIVEQTPMESLEDAYQSMKQSLAEELLAQVKTASSRFFEKLVVELLVRMGYGGSMRDAAEATRPTADGGIDGIIKEDALGLDTIYIQAKRWEGPVGTPELQKFVGALQGRKARKGVFITTSHFSKGVQEYISKIDTNIVPIDGEYLVQLMIDHDIGVARTQSFEIKRMDTDYFTEE